MGQGYLIVKIDARTKFDLKMDIRSEFPRFSSEDITAIPGTRSADHLHENPKAIDVQLTRADLREIKTALSKIEVRGGRMNEERMKAVDQTV
jgi:aryl-alcohol dehydrogenase-like predicted oxidoreductase